MMTDATTTVPASDLTTKADLILTEVEQITASTAKIATATVWTAVIGFFTALPGIVALIRDFMNWLNVISGNNPQAYLSKLGGVFGQMAAAKSQEDRTNAAKNLSDLISKLPTK